MALRSRDEALLGGMTIAEGHADRTWRHLRPELRRVTVTGKDNYLSGALDITLQFYPVVNVKSCPATKATSFPPCNLIVLISGL